MLGAKLILCVHTKKWYPWKTVIDLASWKGVTSHTMKLQLNRARRKYTCQVSNGMKVHNSSTENELAKKQKTFVREDGFQKFGVRLALAI